MLKAGRAVAASRLPNRAEELKAALDRVEARIPGWQLNPEALHLVRMAMEKKISS